RTTDANGNFTENTLNFINGTYNWWAKGPKYLANAGTLTLTGTQTINLEIGVMKVGDANDDNTIGLSDFNILRNAFGTFLGNPGYDDRADFDGNQRVDISDFNLLRANF